MGVPKHDFNFVEGRFMLDLPNHVRLQIFPLDSGAFKWEYRFRGGLMFCGVQPKLALAKEKALFIFYGDDYQ